MPYKAFSRSKCDREPVVDVLEEAGQHLKSSKVPGSGLGSVLWTVKLAVERLGLKRVTSGVDLPVESPWKWKRLEVKKRSVVGPGRVLELHGPRVSAEFVARGNRVDDGSYPRHRAVVPRHRIGRNGIVRLQPTAVRYQACFCADNCICS